MRIEDYQPELNLSSPAKPISDFEDVREITFEDHDERKCANCGTSLAGMRANATYCSRDCKESVGRRRRYAEKVGKEFTLAPTEKPQTRVVSVEASMRNLAEKEGVSVPELTEVFLQFAIKKYKSGEIPLRVERRIFLDD